MNIFDQLVDEALKHQPDLAPLRVVVEKELLHHDILRVLSDAGLLKQLTFMGGTCLRACYGSSRLSEDLDFTGGADFKREHLSSIARLLIDSLQLKYGLSVEVTEPMREKGNVDTWKLKIQTRPGRKDMPSQRINMDVCAIPSYQKQPMMLLNPYGVEMGTSGLIVQAESREEIFADKLVAFALRPNRIKYRDVWDILWLHQQGLKLSVDLIALKVKDHHCEAKDFVSLLDARRGSLRTDSKVVVPFRHEMARFLSTEAAKIVEQATFWDFLVNLMDDLCRQISWHLVGM